jgi:hypothetical protein
MSITTGLAIDWLVANIDARRPRVRATIGRWSAILDRNSAKMIDAAGSGMGRPPELFTISAGAEILRP